MILFQFVRRRYKPDFPVSANFYPIATSAILDSPKERMTLLTGQSNSGSNRNPGEIELLIDRKHIGNDQKGPGNHQSKPSTLEYNVVLQGRHSNSMVKCLCV